MTLNKVRDFFMAFCSKKRKTHGFRKALKMRVLASLLAVTLAASAEPAVVREDIEYGPAMVSVATFLWRPQWNGHWDQ